MWQNKLKEIIYIELTTWGRRYRVMKEPPIVTTDADLSDANRAKPSQPSVGLKNPHEVAS
ncbi:hypothetical protein ACFL46_06210 [Candidatus Neomarinimicrobiota bacterium]